MKAERLSELATWIDRALEAESDVASVMEQMRSAGLDESQIGAVADLAAAGKQAAARGFLSNHLAPAWETSTNSSPETREEESLLQPGTVVGRYRIAALIGRGGMGEVYRAERLEDYRRIVAVKILRSHGLSADAGKRFERERQALAELVHPGIVGLLDGGTTSEGRPYFVMEYVDGPNLAAFGAERLSLRERVVLYRSICDAVAFAHFQGCLHRDIKPSNVLVSGSGRPVLTDFGLTRRLEAEDELTGSGAILGTPNYMAPEQVDGKPLDERVDVYGLGGLLYALLTGRPPFRGATAFETMQAARTMAPEPPSRFDRQLPRDLETICLKALAKDPQRRFAGVEELAAEIDRWLTGRPIHSRRIGAFGRFARWAKRNPALAAVTTTSAVLLVGALVVVTAFWQTAKSDKERAERNLATAREAIRSIARQAENLRLQPGQEHVRREMLETALTFSEKLAVEYPDDEATVDELARSHYFLAQLLSQGHSQVESAATFRKAIALWEHLQSRFPKKPQYPYELYRTYWLLSELPVSGVPTLERRDLKTNAFAILEMLTAQFPDDSRYWDSLSAMCPSMASIHQEDDPAKAAQFLERGAEVAMWLDRTNPERQYIGNAAANLLSLASLTADRLGDCSRAIELSRKALDIYLQLCRRFPNNRDYQFQVASAKDYLAWQLAKTEHLEEAERLSREALISFDLNTAISPTLPAASIYSCGSRFQLGNLLTERGRLDEARGIFKLVRKQIESTMSKPNPSHVLYQMYARHLVECPLVEFRDAREAVRMMAMVDGILPANVDRFWDWELRAKILYREGNFGAALEILNFDDNRKVSFAFESTSARFVKALCLAKLNRMTEASQALQEALNAVAPRRAIGKWKCIWQKEVEQLLANRSSATSR